MHVMGIDIGSVSSKVVVLDENKEIVTVAVVPLGTGSSGPEKALKLLEDQHGLSLLDMDQVCVTGYGRLLFQGANRQISEITCHAKGIHHLAPSVHTIIDIGGQDVKAIIVGKDGKVTRFFMNDKCAAGTGRFLDVMSNILELKVSSLAEIGSNADYPAPISSTCTVFAESEVISQLSKGEKKENIIAGIHQSVAVKAVALARRAGIQDDIMMTGGVALNLGVVKAVENELGRSIMIPEKPQITGALGAAVYAYEDCQKQGV